MTPQTSATRSPTPAPAPHSVPTLRPDFPRS
jgi:hypothetical protein